MRPRTFPAATSRRIVGTLHPAAALANSAADPRGAGVAPGPALEALIALPHGVTDATALAYRDTAGPGRTGWHAMLDRAQAGTVDLSHVGSHGRALARKQA